jgi:hypothetical protein
VAVLEEVEEQLWQERLELQLFQELEEQVPLTQSLVLQ